MPIEQSQQAPITPQLIPEAELLRFAQRHIVCMQAGIIDEADMAWRLFRHIAALMEHIRQQNENYAKIIAALSGVVVPDVSEPPAPVADEPQEATDAPIR